MIRNRSIWFLLLVFCSVSSAIAQDTVKIKEVEVLERAQPKEISSQRVDSMALMDPTNKDLGASLQKYSHAFVKSYGIGSMATVSLRGSGSAHTNLIWNGVSMNSASIGVVDFSLIPPIFTDELVVNYGLNSSETASGGLGGSVSMNSTVDFASKEKLLLQQQFGSFDHSSTSARLKLGNEKLRTVTRLLYKTANNNFDYQDISEAEKPRTTVENARLEQKGILQSLHYRPSESSRLDAHFWYFNSERELPNMMSLRDLEESQFDENIRLQFAYHQYFDKHRLSVNSTLMQDEIIYRNNQLENDSRSLNNSIRNFLKLSSELGKYSILNRLDFDKEYSRQKSYANDLIDRNRFAYFLSARRALYPFLDLELSLRQEWIEDDYFFLPQMRMNFYALEDRLNIWVLLGQNMKYPSLNDLYWEAGGNSELIAEESSSIELGQSYNFQITEKSRLVAKTTFYYSLIEDYIQWTPSELGFWQAQNLKEVESKGVEVDLNLEIKQSKWRHSYSLIYNYVNSINLEKNHPNDASVGKQLVYIPEHQYDLNARWMFKTYLLEANLQFVGARYLLSDNSDFLPYYNLLDLSLGKDWKLGNDLLSCRISARNLLDEDYQAIQWRPMPGRNYMLTLNLQFQ